MLTAQEANAEIAAAIAEAEILTCDICGKEVVGVEFAASHKEWHNRKAEGEKVATLLLALPLGTEFTLAGAGRAYSATYRKNSDGTWDQVYAVEKPYVRSMDAAHLGFCVGSAAVAEAVKRTAV